MKPPNFIAPILAFFSALTCYAQDTSVIFIRAGSSILEKLPPAKRYKYHEFRTGKVVFKDSSIATSKLNYSFLSGEVEFIGPTNDTLAIADDKASLIKDILIDSNVFYYNKEFFEEIANHPETGRLLKKQLFSEMDREKIGAYDMASPTSAVQTYSSVGNKIHSIVEGLVAKENLFLKVTEEYFMENKNNETVRLTKKNLLKLYSPRKRAINDYLDKNPVNFNREDDLKRLFLAINN